MCDCRCESVVCPQRSPAVADAMFCKVMMSRQDDVQGGQGASRPRGGLLHRAGHGNAVPLCAARNDKEEAGRSSTVIARGGGT